MIGMGPGGRASTPQRSIALELTRPQIDEVLRQTEGGGVMSLLLVRGRFDSRLDRESGPSGNAWIDDPRLSKSLLLGLWVLSLLPASGSSWTGVGEIARATGLSKSSAHRYLNTLLEAGLAERNPASRKYRLPAVGVGRG
jgi:DNA-binding transcriptional ArsR family regulator